MLNQVVKVIKKTAFVPTEHRKPTQEELQELVMKSEVIITKQRKRINRLLNTNDFLLEQRSLCTQNQHITHCLAEFRDAVTMTIKNNNVSDKIKMQLIAGALKNYHKAIDGGANEMFRQEQASGNEQPQ